MSHSSINTTVTIVLRRFDVIIMALVAIGSVAIKIMQVVRYYYKLAEALICTWLAVSCSMNRTAVHLQC